MKNNIENGIYIPDEKRELHPLDEWMKREDPTTAQTVVLVTDYGMLEIAKQDCHYVKIDTNGKFIYTIDSRSNKLKALMEFYEVPILTDDKFKNIDLRNFKFKENGNNVSNN